MLLGISQNSQENTFNFENTFNTCNFIKKETLAQVFSRDFCGICKNTFLYRRPLVAASVWITFAVKLVNTGVTWYILTTWTHDHHVNWTHLSIYTYTLDTRRKLNSLIHVYLHSGHMTLAQVFYCEFCEIFKNIFFIEHFSWLLLNCKSSI